MSLITSELIVKCFIDLYIQYEQNKKNVNRSNQKGSDAFLITRQYSCVS